MVDGDMTKTDYILKQNYISVLNWLVLLKERNDRINEAYRKNKVI
jgi:hypothetical protein